MKKRYTYKHEGDETRTLEVTGHQLEEAAGEFSRPNRTYVLRLDHIVVDFPTANIITETVIEE